MIISENSMPIPKVSVIVPNYNHAPYLRQRLDSIFNQSFQDFEVIILDDCSTDNSKEIIEEYRNHPQVSHVVYNETNSGSPFKQWAKGFDLAQGEYIWIAESDDWSEAIFLEELMPQINQNQDILVAFCQSIYSYSHSTKIANFISSSCIMSGKDFFNKHMLFCNSICNASSVLFRKDALKKIPSFYQDFHGAGDYLFWIEFLLIGNIAYIHKPLNHFRQHSSNTTTTNRTSGNEFYELYQIFCYLCKRKAISFFMQKVLILHYINRIELAHKHDGLDLTHYRVLRHLWGKNPFNILFLNFFVFFGKFFWDLASKSRLFKQNLL